MLLFCDIYKWTFPFYESKAYQNKEQSFRSSNRLDYALRDRNWRKSKFSKN